MSRSPRDPRPELTIAIASSTNGYAPIDILHSATNADHRYRILLQDSPGSDLADLTLLWAPVFPDPLSWIGVEQPGATLRPDARLLIVLSNAGTRQKRNIEAFDEIERNIREKLYDLGVPGDEITFVRQGKIAGSQEKPGGPADVIEAINRMGQPRRTGYDSPFLSQTFRFHPDPSTRSRGNGRAGALATPSSRLIWRALVEVGTVREGDPITLQGNELVEGTIERLLRIKGSSPTAPVAGAVERFERAEFTVVTQHPITHVNPWRMVYGSTRFTRKLDLHVTHACGPRGSILDEVPSMTESLSPYLPSFGQSVPCLSTDFGLGPDGRGVSVYFSTLTPVFVGPVFLVDHGEQIVLRCEQT